MTTTIKCGLTGESVEDTYGGKPLLVLDGEPVFAELAILREFQRLGWEGVWVDTFRRVYRTGYWNDTGIVDLPPEREGSLIAIGNEAGTGLIGCWDVFCWKGEMTLFIEAKRRGRDRIRESQRRWLQAALGVGFSLKSFLIVEWSSR